MKRPLTSFLLFYLLGATFSPVLAHVDIATEQGLWMAVAEDVAEVGQEWNEWLPQSPEFGGENHFFNIGHFNSRPSQLAMNLAVANQAKASRNKAVSQPLYLLFHALVLYDLH